MISGFFFALERAVEASRERLPSNPSREHEVVRIDVRRYWGSKAHPAIAEYEKYSLVYFLNEAAMELFREETLDFSVLKVIPENELPEGVFTYFQEPYLPADQ